MQDVEIEIKVRGEGVDELKAHLKKHGSPKYESYQKDEYFSPAHRDFAAIRPVKEWLRIRTTNNGCSINYKNWHYDADGVADHCDEYESPVTDVDQVQKIFQALNMVPVVTVEKQRQAWSLGDYEVVIDDVTDLGQFVEVEFTGDTSGVDPKEIASQMLDMLKQAGMSKMQKNYQGYAFMLMNPDEVKFVAV